jgi:hypothetical protein
MGRLRSLHQFDSQESALGSRGDGLHIVHRQRAVVGIIFIHGDPGCYPFMLLSNKQRGRPV